jgi:hypothetical protein
MQRTMWRVPGSDALQDNVRCFWKIQDRILYITKNFADGWFERRHVGSHAALEAAQRMCNARTGVDLAQELQEWGSGAFQRVMADGLACQQLAAAFVGALSDKQENEPQQAGTKTLYHAEAA